jgi:hypothetical protein
MTCYEKYVGSTQLACRDQGRSPAILQKINAAGLPMTTRWFLSICVVLISLSACGGSVQQALPQAEPDLIAVLKSRPSLRQFTAALESSGVGASLQANGTYTIFAPIDKAVGQNGPLDAATVRHHILAERVTFSDIAGESTSYTTLHSDDIEIDATETIRIGEGLMVESDITAANGIIHVIDKVLPPGEVPTNLAPAATNDPNGLSSNVGPAAPAATTQ